MADTLNLEKTNVTDAQNVVQRENIKPQNINNADAKSFQKETKNTLTDLQTKNETMSKQISNLVETMRAVSAPQPNIIKPDLADEVWKRIRTYQASLKGVNLNLKK